MWTQWAQWWKQGKCGTLTPSLLWDPRGSTEVPRPDSCQAPNTMALPCRLPLPVTGAHSHFIGCSQAQFTYKKKMVLFLNFGNVLKEQIPPSLYLKKILQVIISHFKLSKTMWFRPSVTKLLFHITSNASPQLQLGHPSCCSWTGNRVTETFLSPQTWTD